MPRRGRVRPRAPRAEVIPNSSSYYVAPKPLHASLTTGMRSPVDLTTTFTVCIYHIHMYTCLPYVCDPSKTAQLASRITVSLVSLLPCACVQDSIAQQIAQCLMPMDQQSRGYQSHHSMVFYIPYIKRFRPLHVEPMLADTLWDQCGWGGQVALEPRKSSTFEPPAMCVWLFLPLRMPCKAAEQLLLEHQTGYLAEPKEQGQWRSISVGFSVSISVSVAHPPQPFVATCTLRQSLE